MIRFARGSFDHVGIPTTVRHDGESWIEPTRVWVTSPRAHPFNVEWLRYEPDSPVTGALRDQPHIAYRVADLTQAIEGHRVVLEAFDVGGGFARVAFVVQDDVVVELIQYANPDTEEWF